MCYISVHKLYLLPENAIVARRDLSRGGAHLAQMAWIHGYVTPYRVNIRLQNKKFLCNKTFTLSPLCWEASCLEDHLS